MIPPSDLVEVETPDLIEAGIRSSRAPAHLNVTWPHGRPRKKIPPRPQRHQSAAWSEVDYNDRVFGEQVRGDPPIMRRIPIEDPGAQARHESATWQ